MQLLRDNLTVSSSGYVSIWFHNQHSSFYLALDIWYTRRWRWTARRWWQLILEISYLLSLSLSLSSFFLSPFFVSCKKNVLCSLNYQQPTYHRYTQTQTITHKNIQTTRLLYQFVRSLEYPLDSLSYLIFFSFLSLILYWCLLITFKKWTLCFVVHSRCLNITRFTSSKFLNYVKQTKS